MAGGIPKTITDDDPKCGIGSCRPKSIQPCANLYMFTTAYCVLSVLLNTISTLLSSQITSLEKQFNFSSTVSGLLISCNDIGYLSFVLFTSYSGRFVHIPRLLGFSGLLFGVCGVVIGLSNFIEPYSLPKNLKANETFDPEAKYLCHNGSEEWKTENETTQDSGDSSVTLWIIGICMVIYGISKTPRNGISSVYIDNNVQDKNHSSSFIGAVMAAIILGPSLALATGSAFLKLPVDLQDTYLVTSDPRWVGAWWLGFLVFGGAGVLVSIPLFCFPKRMKVSQSEKKPDMPLLGKMKDMPLSLLRILKRPVYTLSVFNGISYAYAVTGVLVFGPKYVEYQFNIPAWKSSLILGIMNLVVSVAGTFIGGILNAKLKLSRQGIIKFILITHLFGLGVNTLSLVFGCENTSIEGYDYFLNETEVEDDCACEKHAILPVCGEDRVTYLSPCRAGCWNRTDDTFMSCSRLGVLTATPGICDNGCQYLIPYLASQALVSALTSLAMVPHAMLNLRSVDEKDKAIALGMNNFLLGTLGYLPAPILYGNIIDSSCKISQQTSSGRSGACALYDIVDLRYKIFGMEVSLKVFAFIIQIAILFVCRWEDSKILRRKTDSNALSLNDSITDNGDVSQSREKSDKDYS